jgi:serine/threonine-protein kinase
MSPEQAMGKPIDRRTDIWAAGVVAWELLAGRRLHQEQSDAAVLLKIVTDFPRELSEVRSDVPEVVARVVQKALMLEAPDRYATAADFRAQLLEAWQVSWGLADNDEVGAWARRMVSTTMEDTLNVPTTVVGARTRR